MRDCERLAELRPDDDPGGEAVSEVCYDWIQLIPPAARQGRFDQGLTGDLLDPNLLLQGSLHAIDGGLANDQTRHHRRYKCH